MKGRKKERKIICIYTYVWSHNLAKAGSSVFQSSTKEERKEGRKKGRKEERKKGGKEERKVERKEERKRGRKGR